MNSRVGHLKWSGVLLGLGLAAALHGGELAPPAGPIQPTLKSLSEVEPRIAVNATNTPGDVDALFKITQPGSYYLTGNISGVSGSHGVEIASGGVTLDLMGFDLLGAAGALSGVFASTTDNNVAVFNGSVRNWGGSGVDVSAAVNTRLANLSVSGNAMWGIYAGRNALVTDCVAFQNTGNGIDVFRNGSVINCFARENGGAGIITLQGCVVWSCGAFANSGDGISVNIASTVSNCSARQSGGNGIVTADGCAVSDCVAVFNTLDGIRVSNDSLVRGNTCRSNGLGAGDGAGIHVTGADNRIEDNNCVDADRGIGVDVAGNLIIKNTCSGNTTDWVIVANNVFGPIIDRRTPASAAVNGFSAPDSTGSTHPNANFSY